MNNVRFNCKLHDKTFLIVSKTYSKITNNITIKKPIIEKGGINNKIFRYLLSNPSSIIKLNKIQFTKKTAINKIPKINIPINFNLFPFTNINKKTPNLLRMGF
jgi:hypothetical protein